MRDDLDGPQPGFVVVRQAWDETDGHDLAHAVGLEEGDVLLGQALEEVFVPQPAGRVAAALLFGPERPEHDPGGPQDLDEGRRDAAAAVVVSAHAADPEQVFGAGHVLDVLDPEGLGPFGPLGEAEAPGIGVGLHVPEEGVELLRELALHQDLAAAGPDDLADVLDLDRALLLAGAAGRAGPDLALREGPRDEPGEGVALLGDERLVSGEKGPFHVEEDHLGRQRLAAGEGRAGV
ncbi:MAG: hypothetical protein MUE80_03480, partial [Acidobacteria bacterium]|nr:hypothetical protein [Acidobacteriota bacterium]